MAVLKVFIADCLKSMDSLVLDESIDLVLTDPPYGLSAGHVSQEENKQRKFKVNFTSKGDWDSFETEEDLKKFTRDWLYLCMKKLKDGGSILINATHHNLYITRELLIDLGFNFKQLIHWHHPNFTPMMTNRLFVYTVEYVLWATKGDGYKFNSTKEAYNNMTKQPLDLIVVNRAQGTERVEGHPTQKPSQLNQHFIKIFSDEGDMVLDCFLGTGSTMRDCKALNRNCIGFEMRHECMEMIKKKVGWGLQPLSGEQIVYRMEIIDEQKIAKKIEIADSEIQQVIQEYDGLISRERAVEILKDRKKR